MSSFYGVGKGTRTLKVSHMNLNHARLPISPSRHTNFIQFSTTNFTSTWLNALSRPLLGRYLIFRVGRVPSRHINFIQFSPDNYRQDYARSGYFIFLKNSSEINCEYLFFSLTEIKSLCSPSFISATETIPPTSPIGSFFTRASNFT